MGTLYCLKCDQTVEAGTFAEADSLIDHGAKSIQCSGDKEYIRWNGEKIVKTVVTIPQTVPKTKTSTTAATKHKKK